MLLEEFLTPSTGLTAWSRSSLWTSKSSTFIGMTELFLRFAAFSHLQPCFCLVHIHGFHSPTPLIICTLSLWSRRIFSYYFMRALPRKSPVCSVPCPSLPSCFTRCYIHAFCLKISALWSTITRYKSSVRTAIYTALLGRLAVVNRHMIVWIGCVPLIP